MYSINEIFESIQGEGSFVGTPSLFIRFAGCNLTCPWCDTDVSERMILTGEELFSIVNETTMPHMVVTGGEPTLQDIGVLLLTAATSGMTAQVETNGTTSVSLPQHSKIFVTVSPKTSDFVRRSGHELKILFDGTVDPEEVRRDTEFAHYFLQPLWEKGKDNHEVVIDYIHRHPHWRLSIQTHKYLGVR